MEDEIAVPQPVGEVAAHLSAFLGRARRVVLVLVDREGVILRCNPGFADLLGRAEEDLPGARLRDHLTTPDAERVTRWWDEATSGDGEPVRLNVVDRDGAPQTIDGWIGRGDDHGLILGERAEQEERGLQEQLLQLNNRLAVLTRENARKTKSLALALDKLKRAQAMLVHQEKMASLGVMTAGVAHEINNPLAFVLGNVQTLRRDFDDLLAFANVVGDALEALSARAPGVHDAIVDKATEIELDLIAESIPRKLDANREGLERIKEIVLDLRTFSRLDEAERKPASLADGVRAAIRFLGPLANGHDVSIDAELASLPPILCAPGPINQVVVNILSNAIQASAPGQVVRVRTSGDARAQQIEISDEGCGIPSAHRERVLDPFFTTKPVGSGTGLGLSIASRIVESHEGTLTIDSAEGEGTRVCVRLPVRVEERGGRP